jgi:2-succinyl-5-enolpyruvyl-6-hydroxy-3-cyclohexene-1-carboxylate synthase
MLEALAAGGARLPDEVLQEGEGSAGEARADRSSSVGADGTGAGVSGPANTLWARAWVDELARCGVREIAVAPGSRSTPLVLAFARDGRFRMRVHLDERSAAFFALGVGKATGVPAAVVTTSGSAVANLFPAVVEANQAETPLLVLTADRPPRLRGSDANQAIDQGRIFGTYARAFFEAGPPAASGPELRHLRQMACRAVDAAGGPPAGAVHVNFPFDKPLEPLERGMDALAAEHPLAVRGRPDGRRFTAVARSDGVPSADAVARVAEICAAGRGLVVAGPSTDPARIGPAVLRFAERAGFPVLADPLSGARFGPDHGALRIAVYDLLLRAPAARTALAPEVIVRVGSSPTSAVLQDWLVEQNGTPYAVADAGLRWKDHGATATEYLAGDPVATLELLGDALEEGLRPDGRREVGWAGLWRAVDGAVRGVLAEADEDSEPTHEGALWPRLARALPEAVVFVSSSMPVRDLDVFGVPEERAWTVFGNRGASGIDGIVSTAFGVAAGPGRPTSCASWGTSRSSTTRTASCGAARPTRPSSSSSSTTTAGVSSICFPSWGTSPISPHSSRRRTALISDTPHSCTPSISRDVRPASSRRKSQARRARRHVHAPRPSDRVAARTHAPRSRRRGGGGHHRPLIKPREKLPLE